MADCNICLISLRNVKAKVSCVDCKNGYHGKCVNLILEDSNYLTQQGDVWCCDPCSKTRRKSTGMVLETKSNVSFDDIFNLITELKNDCKKVEVNIGASLNSCHEELAETKAMASKQREELAAWMETVVDLESRLEDIEQYSRLNTLEIYGIPIQKGENVVTLVKAVARTLDYPVDDTMPPGIVVKMVRGLDAEGLLQKRRVKRNLNTHDIGLTSAPAEVLYVNECLSSARQDFFTRLDKLKRKGIHLCLDKGRKDSSEKGPRGEGKVCLVNGGLYQFVSEYVYFI
ncbi:hypothetical protein J6590_090132 [Homalodisca vitripennis]|nr:hypothetical protein J6590_090132 [Homalodisca vitripennis]